MQSRLSFANEHQHWDAKNWNEIIFTDEKVFQSYPNCVVHVSRPRGHRNFPQFFADKKVSGRFSVNCHLWMTGNGLGGLNRIHGLRHGTSAANFCSLQNWTKKYQRGDQRIFCLKLSKISKE
jgi:hypothetical protein